MKKLYWLLFIILFSSSCINPDWYDDHYSEDITNNLFLSNPDEKLLEKITSIKVYKTKYIYKSTGWHSEKWLKSNNINYILYFDKILIKKFILSLNNSELSSKITRFIPNGIEYHVIVHLGTGDKAYARVQEGLQGDSLCEVITYTDVVYGVKKDIDKDGLIMFSQIDKDN